MTLKLTTLLGRYSLDRHGNRYYAMARNLALDLAAAYDAALADVLVMPILPMTAFDIPSGSADLEEVRAISAGDGMCLRVAQAYEAAVGGFPAPPR